MLGRLATFVFPYVVFVLQAGVFCWALRRWLQASPRISPPAWRSYTAICAFCFAVVSFVLWLVLFVWARVVGGFPYYDPFVLRFYGFGLLTGTMGLVGGLIGKGKLRWPACGMSALMAFLWLAAASSE
ncbi:MAG: hypothetical protein WBE13_03435 [Candidatus Acidiferrum sp.]